MSVYNGDLTIENDSISDLTSLNLDDEIDGDLIISSCDELVSLKGLPKKVNGNLIIEFNTLDDISDLNNIEIEGVLIIKKTNINCPFHLNNPKIAEIEIEKSKIEKIKIEQDLQKLSLKKIKNLKELEVKDVYTYIVDDIGVKKVKHEELYHAEISLLYHGYFDSYDWTKIKNLKLESPALGDKIDELDFSNTEMNSIYISFAQIENLKLPDTIEEIELNQVRGLNDECLNFKKFPNIRKITLTNLNYDLKKYKLPKVLDSFAISKIGAEDFNSFGSNVEVVNKLVVYDYFLKSFEGLKKAKDIIIIGISDELDVWSIFELEEKPNIQNLYFSKSEKIEELINLTNKYGFLFKVKGKDKIEKLKIIEKIFFRS